MAARAEPRWRHAHLLDVDVLDHGELETVIERAEAHERDPAASRGALRDRRLATLFYEPSTRTRLSFELAARALGAVVVDLPVAASSVTKGESLIDTVRTLGALGIEFLVIRHPRSGAPWLAARHFPGHVINAGDGRHAHPTQALADLLTLRHRLPRPIQGARVTIVGDVLHSRVARSDIWALTTMGASVTLCGPAVWLSGFDAWADAMPGDRRLAITTDLAAALRGADAVMALRVQRERLAGVTSLSESAYVAGYGLTAERMRTARPGALVMHPGPMNEGVEIMPDVVAGPASVITQQVTCGVLVRSAVLALLAETDTRG